MSRYLIAGLGNPGPEYEHTRHNAGFEVMDVLAREYGASYWKSEGGAATAHCSYHGNEVILAKPQSFMNKSGGPVASLFKKYDIEIDRLIVVHDELDIPAGMVKVKKGGGSAGHNGIKSIAEKLQTPAWIRVRCGIGRPPGRMDVVRYVLSVPKKDQFDLFMEAVDHSAEAVCSLLDVGLNKTQQQFNIKSVQ